MKNQFKNFINLSNYSMVMLFDLLFNPQRVGAKRKATLTLHHVKNNFPGLQVIPVRASKMG